MGRGFWQDRKNHKLAIQHLGKELGIKKCNDWYTVMYDDFEKAGIISVLGFQEYKGSYAKCIIKNLPKCNLNESKFYEYAKKFKENGATILGGCCETRPSHIKAISKLK